MGARHVLVAGAMVALLAGCSDDGGDDAAAKATTNAAPETAAVDELPKGDEAAFLEAMRSLDAKLVADEKTAVDSGYNLCQDLKNDMTAGEVSRDAASLYEVDIKKAQRIYAIAKTHLCK